MTQVDSYLEGQEKSTSTKAKNGNSSSNELDQLSMSGPHHNFDLQTSTRCIKLYQNGHTTEVPQPALLNPEKSQSWSEVLQILHEASNLPVQNVFTVHGKRIASWTELQRIGELVVCSGSERFKMVPYGKQTPERGRNTNGGSQSQQQLGYEQLYQLKQQRLNKSLAKVRGKKSERVAHLVKSVIVEPGHRSENESKLELSNPLMKTLSEQDVSGGMEKCSRVRVRQCSPKPRPVSAYHHYANMTSSSERKSLGLGVSKIPVPRRVITPAPSATNNSTPTTTTGIPNPIRSRRLEKLSGGEGKQGSIKFVILLVC